MQNYSDSFRAALKTGKALIRRVWPSAKDPNKVSVQLIQEVDVPTSTSAMDPAVAWSLGLEGVGKNLVTVIVPMTLAKATQAGLKVGTYFDGQEVVFASDIWPFPVCIELVETTEPNPWLKSHDPVVNPSTGQVMTHGGLPIYRHTYFRAAPYVEATVLERDTAKPVGSTSGADSSEAFEL